MCYFLGHLSPNDAPGHYMACLRSCYDDFLEYKSSNQTEKIPLIINTMGWNQGLGLCLLKESILLFKPNIIVQLNHPVEANKNMPLLDKNWLMSTDGWPPSINKTSIKALINKDNRSDINLNTSKSFTSSECLESMDIDIKIDSNSNINYNLVILKSGTPFKSNKFQIKSPQKRFSARDHRNIAIIAYFSSLFDPKSFFTPINYLRPYKISWSKITLHVIHSKVDYDQLLRVFNASLIGLCQIDPKYVSFILIYIFFTFYFIGIIIN
jgi:polynucleotide 5'-hydroxyl-kinase GRC3/NOL9